MIMVTQFAVAVVLMARILPQVAFLAVSAQMGTLVVHATLVLLATPALAQLALLVARMARPHLLEVLRVSVLMDTLARHAEPAMMATTRVEQLVSVVVLVVLVLLLLVLHAPVTMAMSPFPTLPVGLAQMATTRQARKIALICNAIAVVLMGRLPLEEWLRALVMRDILVIPVRSVMWVFTSLALHAHPVDLMVRQRPQIVINVLARMATSG